MPQDQHSSWLMDLLYLHYNYNSKQNADKYKADRCIKNRMKEPYLIKPTQPDYSELHEELISGIQKSAEQKEQRELEEIKRQQHMIELLESIDRTLKEIKDELGK